MPSLLPGMNPYLEQPTFWAEFHQRLIMALADAITPKLSLQYYVGVETRTYLDDTETEIFVGIPDAVILSSHSQSADLETASVAVQTRPTPVQLPIPAEVRERYLEVREVGTEAVITVIEVLSPKNKRLGEGRNAYERKRQLVLSSLSNLVEIDLLRGGSAMAMTGQIGSSAYRVLVSQYSNRPTADLYGFGLQESIPAFPLPLKPEDAAIRVDLQAIALGVYDRGRYDLRIDYRQSVPAPALSEADRQWLNQLLSHCE
jgi:hypothetical protein